MKIGLDISQLAYPGGVATYTQNLAHGLLSEKDLDLQFFYASLRKPYRGTLPQVKSFPLPPAVLEFIFNRMRLVPIEQFIGPVDIFHSSDWTQPPTQAKKVTTYHDTIPLKYPQWSHPKIVEVNKRRLRLVEKEVDMVIVVSEATKNDLLEVSKIPEEKIRVIYEGFDEKFEPISEGSVEKFRLKYQLPEKFVLSIGGSPGRRNLAAAKEAVRDYPLVITGETIPWIPDEEMPLLYNAATLLLYPSLYEGFGLPVLEAMACGTPVITSNVSSMPEVGGEAAVYVNPKNIEEIKRTVREVMDDKGKRDVMREEGLAQAKKFSWKTCAQKTYEVYKDLIES